MRIRRQARRLARLLAREEGFSLTELLVAAALMLVVLAAAYGIWFGLQRTVGFVDEDMKAQAEARYAMAEMVELIRTAREPDTPVPAEMDLVIVRAEPNLLVCWTDVDRDENHDLELVRFRVDIDGEGEQSLFRDTSDVGDFAVASLTRLVGKWVSNGSGEEDWLFTYVGANGAPLPMTEDLEGDPMHVEDPTKIREVHILLKVDVTLGKSPAHHELTNVVQPRNLRNY